MSHYVSLGACTSSCLCYGARYVIKIIMIIMMKASGVQIVQMERILYSVLLYDYATFILSNAVFVS